MLDTFFVSQATWAAEDGRDLTPFSAYRTLFYLMASKNTTKYFEKLLVANKVRFMVWYEKGVSTTSIVDHPGPPGLLHEGPSCRCKGLSKKHHPWEKRQPGHPATIKSYSSKGLDGICVKKLGLPFSTIKLEVSEFRRPCSPLHESPKLAVFCSGKPCFFRPFYGICILFFLTTDHHISFL